MKYMRDDEYRLSFGNMEKWENEEKKRYITKKEKNLKEEMKKLSQTRTSGNMNKKYKK